MKKNLKKYIESYKRYGILNTVKELFSKIGINIKLYNGIQKKRIYLSRKINELCNGEVIDGIYNVAKFIYSSDYFMTKSAYLLGCYEKEVQQIIYNLSKKNNLKYFINVGAGEGYHAIGVKVANLFENSISFELDKKNRDIIKKNFDLNKIFNGFEIFSNANIDFLKNIEKKIEFTKSLFLFDIEGDEFKILDENNLNIIQNSYLIIELHHFYSTENKVENLTKQLKKYFNISFFKTENRNFSNFEILNKFNDDEKWLMMSESRPCTMKWIICEPIKK